MGNISERSRYCPFDLFSGNESRMKRAIQALLLSPQNNLKIFKDGLVQYDSKSQENDLTRLLNQLFQQDNHLQSLESFSTLICSALQTPFYDDQPLSMQNYCPRQSGDSTCLLRNFPASRNHSYPELFDKTKELLILSQEVIFYFIKSILNSNV